MGKKFLLNSNIFKGDYKASFAEIYAAYLRSLAKIIFLSLETFEIVVFKTGFKKKCFPWVRPKIC